MKPVPMLGHSQCLPTAIASVFELDPADVPRFHEPWDDYWHELRAWMANRGWRLAFWENPEQGDTLDDLINGDTDSWDDIERQWIWLASVSHPSWGGEAHVVVMRGHELIYDPGGDLSKRPPFDELAYNGGFIWQPLDPARLFIREEKAA